MPLRWMFPLFGILAMLFLAGCFRQAEESFEPIDSQNSNSGQELTPIISGESSEETDIPVLIIDPNATEEAVVETEEIVESSPTLRVINPTATDEEATSTPRPSSTPNTIPTATEATFITPAVNFEATLPTTSPTEFVELSTLEPTPTVEGEEFVAGECDYVVENGDNLFRIAISNEVALPELLAANDLTEASIIQPGQVLTIPNCGEAETTGLIPTEEDEEVLELGDCDYIVQTGDTLFQIALNNDVVLADLLAENELSENAIIQPEQVLRLPDCEDGTSSSNNEEETLPDETTSGSSEEQIHTVASGETLLSIARLYGITVNDLIQANNIPNPNNLTVGQRLVIPQN